VKNPSTHQVRKPESRARRSLLGEMALPFPPVCPIARNTRYSRNIALFMRLVVFQVICAARNIRISRNIRTCSVSRMFRLFPLFRVLGISGKIPCPCVLEPRVTVAPERVLAFVYLLGLDAVGFEHSG
jgi:hypothetical protein